MFPSKQPLDVLSLGFANHDLLLVVDGYPPADSKRDALDLLEQGGGPAATAAVAVARLGGRVALLTTVADDQRGERILSDLAREGVDVSYCSRAPGAISALSLIVVDASAGTRTIFRYRGSLRPELERLDPKLVKGARVLLVDGHLPESALQAARIAREAGLPVVLDPGEPKPALEELLGLADYPISPLHTALWATGESDPEQAALGLLRRGAKAAIVTQGASGYLLATEEGVRQEPAFQVKVVDTTGAGDAFHGGFAFALARGRSVEEAARFAAAVAALKCRKLGGRAGLPTLAEVEALLTLE